MYWAARSCGWASGPGSLALIIASIAIIIVIVALIGVFSSALNSVFQAALYNYANTGQAGQFFDPALLQSALGPITLVCNPLQDRESLHCKLSLSF